ncbi:rhodanese-like domain-containing protein [Aliikangiella coralliicola]|uniref:Rhodanese-like domain-containing protein n=1 Tax=Aliikangiella coralliicola TaxID=2592383 RepID=A0A545UDJ0_9GAMM|nr:rhodanese-like domain-containing protein [Aliikangiella coralliicola]TQV87536.1 rhodanese-like domain-containing protein [Aliikangiella coralliicola]
MSHLFYLLFTVIPVALLANTSVASEQSSHRQEINSPVKLSKNTSNSSVISAKQTGRKSNQKIDLSSVQKQKSESAFSPIETALLLSYLTNKNTFTLIDARSTEEFSHSHVQGAINVPLQAVNLENSQLPEDKNKLILVYCKTGKRASKVAQSLISLGYDNVKVLPAKQLMFKNNLVVFNCGV